jgi:ferric-dicitrate binding protein FerR (iron transport regulator)
MWGHPRRRIDRYLVLGASAPMGEGLREHLRACAGCRAYFDAGVLALRAAKGNLEQAGAGEVERMTARAIAVARPAPERAGGHTRRRLVFAGTALAVAGCVFMLVWGRAPVSVGIVFAIDQELLIDGRPAAVNDKVQSGAVVTARHGDSTLLLEGQRGVLLREGARARFDQAGAEAVLEAGRARFSVKPGQGKFTVVSGETQVKVRGTIFVVDRRNEDETLVAVHRGEVQVSGRSAEVTLREGQECTVAKGTPNAPRPARSGSLAEDRGEGLLQVLRRAWQTLMTNLDQAVEK